MSTASLSPSDSSASSCSSPSEASSPRLIVLTEDLPLPTAPRPFSTKKSHAKKQPLGHIPRPRNAFILFRCDYGRQNERKIRERDQNDVSRMVGTIWRNMTEEQRAPWVHLAEAEKKRHATLYPGYKYTPRNKKSKPTEKEVKRQIAKEAEKAVEAEVVKRVTKANSKDMVTVYYPPWATRRTLTYFSRRATSCPPEGAVSVEPYSEMMDRAMVTTNAKVEDVKQDERPDKEEAQPPSKTAEDVFVPSAYGICDKDSSCSSEDSASSSISADLSLSQGSHTIDPPGGTTSWGEEPPSPSEYPQNAQYAFHHPERLYIPPFFYMPRGKFTMSQYSYAGPPGEPENQANHGNYWPLDLPALTPSPTDTSPSASPVTPTEHSAFPYPVLNDEGVQYGEPQSSGKTVDPEAGSFTAGQEEFLSEFGNVFQPASGVYDGDETFGAGVNIIPRESSIRTTYAPYEGLYTQQ